jgi:hypothetical protein
MSQFETRNSQTAEEWQQDQAERRMAATPEPGPLFGNIGQGTREIVDETFSVANLSNHAFYMKHKADILAAAARQELPGMANFAAGPNN